MTRILHVYKDYYPVLGGIENHLRTLAEAQAARGHSVTVLVASRTRQTHQAEMNGVRILFAGRLATAASTPLSVALPLCLRREQADLVHLQDFLHARKADHHAIPRQLAPSAKPGNRPSPAFS